VLAAVPVAAQDGASDVIIVTGSRIPSQSAAGASPVVAVVQENLEQSGLTNVTDALAQLPALINSEDNFDAAGSQARTGAAGVNLLNLRNLGANRTLVLVNGRRHVSGISGEAAVDTNTIPVGLIERVDVLTGGVSPIYGADGVSGVVNFITRRDFEGFDVRAQQGISDFGDAESTFVSATVGRNFDDDRGNFALSYEYRRNEQVHFSDRPNGSDNALVLIRNPDDIPDDPNVPDRIPIRNITWADSSRDGALVIDFSFAPLFRGGGQPYDRGIVLDESGGRAIGGSNTPTVSYQGDLQAQTEHHSANAFFNYQLTPSVRFFAEGKFVRSENLTASQPSFDFYTFISEENPFIPQNVRDSGLDAFGGLLFLRDNFDFGVRDEALERNVYRTVVGLDGEISDHADFEVSYVFGQNDTTYINDDNRIQDRYFAALDVVDRGLFLNGVADGVADCRVNLDGGAIVDAGTFNYGLAPQTFLPGQCRPLNIFGEGVASQDALDFILADLRNEYTLTQYVLNGFISGDLGAHFELPGGPVGYAIGAEYRYEKSAFNADPLSTQTVIGDPTTGVMADLALLANERGSFDVVEGFAEVSAPLLADMPLAELLEVRAALRISEYSTIGSTTSWSVSGQYAPVRDVRFRASYSQSVRAPNISELFSPRSGTFLGLSDPCDAINLANGTDFREANCTALLGSFGIDLDDFDFGSSPQASASIQGAISGNQALKEESARTWTAGIILQPSMIPGLTITADWYDIHLRDAINTADLQQTAEFCVDAPSLDNAFCNNITRDPVTGFVVNYALRPENVAFFETAGADFTVNYGFDLAGGDIGFTGTLGYLDKLQFLPANGGVVDVDLNEAGSPRWSATADVTWQNDNLRFNYGVQFIGEQLRFERDVLAGNPDIAAPEYLTLDARFIHDIRAEWRTSDEDFSVFAGVNNFTNEMPEVNIIDGPTGWLGRYFFVGMRLRGNTF
jgi:iron complex outermembrane recepter protein